MTEVGRMAEASPSRIKPSEPGRPAARRDGSRRVPWKPRVFEGGTVAGEVHRLTALLCSAGAGISAGVSLTLLRWVPASLPLAVASLGAAVAVPLWIARMDERRDRQSEERTRAKAEQARYDQHAMRLHRDVFSRIPTLRLTPVGASPLEAGEVGLAVEGEAGGVDLRALPGWSAALAHLLSDPTVAAAWEELRQPVVHHLRHRRETRHRLEERVATEVLREYGLPTGLEGGRFHAPPWCDVEAVAGLVLQDPDPRGRLEVIELGRAGPGRSADGAFAVRWGEVEVMRGRTAEQADPLRLAHLVERVAPRESALSRLRSESKEVERGVERFREASRRYADRVALEGSFRGSCEVCRTWGPARRAGEDASDRSPSGRARGGTVRPSRVEIA